MHDINFRAATAIFGHFGIEWNARHDRAGAAGALAWIDFYKEQTPAVAQRDLGGWMPPKTGRSYKP